MKWKKKPKKNTTKCQARIALWETLPWSSHKSGRQMVVVVGFDQPSAFTSPSPPLFNWNGHQLAQSPCRTAASFISAERHVSKDGFKFMLLDTWIEKICLTLCSRTEGHGRQAANLNSTPSRFSFRAGCSKARFERLGPKKPICGMQDASTPLSFWCLFSTMIKSLPPGILIQAHCAPKYICHRERPICSATDAVSDLSWTRLTRSFPSPPSLPLSLNYCETTLKKK